MRKEYREQKEHYKMYKDGKKWVIAGIGALSIAIAAGATTSAQADQLTNTDNQPTVELQAKQATSSKQDAIDDAQDAIDQDNDDIAQNESDTADEQANHDNLADQTDGKQDDVDNAQNDADKANDQVDQDQDNVDNLKPGDDYTDAKDNADKAKGDEEQAQDDADKAQSDKDQAQKDADAAAAAAAKAKAEADAAAKAKADAQAKADAAKNKKDNTDQTTKKHHNPKPVKPGSQKNPSEINSEADLPTELVEPDGLTDAEKNQDHYGSTDPWYKYVGANDKSAVIKAGKGLSASQQKELAEYALALINSFRKQHGLKPIKMSDTVQELGNEVVNLRIRDGEGAGSHTNTNDPYLDEAISRILGGNQYDVIASGENLYGSILENYDVTMLQLKVQLLQEITGMCFADGYWNWGHRDNFLQHTYGSQDEADDIYMSMNFQNYLDPSGTGLNDLIYLFNFWSVRQGTNGVAQNAMNQGLYTEYVNNGYDTIETNPAYTQAVKDYQDALNQLSNAEKASDTATKKSNDANAKLTDANKNLKNAEDAYAAAQAKLADAKQKLADAQKALDEASQKYADQLAAYNDAIAKLKSDQAKADKANKALDDAKKALADNQAAIAASEAKIKNLKDQLKDLQAKLAKDEKALADAKALPDDNDSSDTKNDDTSNPDQNTDVDSNDDNASNQADNSSESTSSETTTNDVRGSAEAESSATSIATKQQVVENANLQKASILPQTSETKNASLSLVGMVGLLISGLGLVKLFKREEH